MAFCFFFLLSLQSHRVLNSFKRESRTTDMLCDITVWEEKNVADWKANKNIQQVSLLSKGMCAGMWERKGLRRVKYVWLHTDTHIFICICLCAQTLIQQVTMCVQNILFVHVSQNRVIFNVHYRTLNWPEFFLWVAAKERKSSCMSGILSCLVHY